MHDPASTSPSSPDPQPPPGPAPGPGGDHTASSAAAHQAVLAVLAWYSQQRLLARRSGDHRRLEELTTQRQRCLDDQNRLHDAGPEEIARIAADYAARLKELESSEPQAEA
ncbi:hypothetical protein ACJ6WF_34515 [Streptomyces sp. MMS24-I2-30]|uniref:hypothetical protein n=1 Tax=Streptomyces sp. MMS24-I2-30 TaxID=3351564 RepID=UPI003896AAD6